MATELASTSLTQGIEEIVSSIFENMLGLATCPVGVEAGGNAAAEVQSLIKLTGGWHGMVSIECTRLQARHFAARFLSLPECRIDGQIARDVVGELTNMIAGNLKPLFASDIQLSVATVFSDKREIVDFNHGICRELFFCCEEGKFAIKIVAASAGH